jgi:acetyl esterase/lipase
MDSQRRGLLAAAVGAGVLTGCGGTAALNALVPRDTYRLDEDIAYGDDPRQRLDAYLPVQAVAGAPLVLFFYGGSWTRGSRGDYRFVGEALASAGIVTVVADYRLSPQVRWTQILQDCAAATRWCVDAAPRLGAARERVHLMGHSAGAYNAAMLALDARWLAPQRLAPRDIAGWIGVAGPYDFLPIGDADTRRAFDWPATPADSQPITHVSAQAPRTLLLAAEDDRTVNPQRNSAGLAERLRRVGVPVQLELLEGVNHVTVIAALGRPLRHLAPVREDVTRFVLA